MRCLYCGKQLPLLKKLTGGGEFCSEAHRQKYQEEYNKLALSRLLQTQNVDSEAPHRGELVLASRQHPALQAGRPPLRALEAPKSADSPLAGNWAPGANRTQRALPPPTPVPTPTPVLPASASGGGKGGFADVGPTNGHPPVISEQPSFLKLPTRPLLPIPPPAPRHEVKAESFRFDTKPDDRQQSRLEQGLPRLDPHKPEPIANRTPAKRDAFSFRPIDPFPVEKPPPPPPAPLPSLAAEELAAEPTPAPPMRPRNEPPPAPPFIAAKLPEPPVPAEAAFIVEAVKRPDPPEVPKLEPQSAEVFTKGKPPKPDGWMRWEPEIQGPPGKLDEPDELFPLFGPPGGMEGINQVVRLQEESEQERREIRKKILENLVKPGDFKQTVPTAPSGPNTVLPICPPAAALEQVPVVFKPKAPAPNPSLSVAPASNGEELWTGWSPINVAQLLRRELTPLAPPVAAAPETAQTNSPIAAPPPPRPAPPAPPMAETPKPVHQLAVSKPPVVEPPRNYKAAEALKSAAQSVIAESAPKVRQTEKPSTPRHEVFVDLSVLGIEEDEDDDAEFLACEGESPPGTPGSQKRRRNSAARDAVRDLVSSPHPPATPAEPKLAQGFQALAWKQPSAPTPRLSSAPLRPKIVFERAPSGVAPAAAIPQESPKSSENNSLVKHSSSLASAWSAKRLKKETDSPHLAPVDSGLSMPVEAPVSESLLPTTGEAPKTVSPARPAIETAKISVQPVTPAAAAATFGSEAPTAPLRTQQKTVRPVEAATTKLPVKQLANASDGLDIERALEAKTTEKPEVPNEAPPAAETNAIERMPRKESSQPPADEPSGLRTSDRAKVNQAKLQETRAAVTRQDGLAKTDRRSKPEPAASSINAAKLPTPEPIPENPPFEAPLLGAGGGKRGSFWANLPVLPKVAFALALVGAIGGGTWFTLHPQGKVSGAAPPKKVQGPAQAGRSLMMNLPGGWSPDWGGDFNRKKSRTISLYRPSVNNDDYRMDFEGQIDSKALGWVFRATDPKNYYATKIEFVRTGPDPSVAMTHFTVVNGYESQKHYSALAKPIRPSSSFRVRLDVRGDEFSAYVNDELVEVWQDERLPKGGFGIMTETGEVGQIRKLQVFELLP